MDADDLYGLAPERFVPERDAVVKALRADGRRALAADVARLRRPSAAAWAVNQLVRGHDQALAELFDAGDALRQAQRDVIAGRGDRHAMHAAAERERAAVAALADAASAQHKLTAAAIDHVADTLHAAALDDAARAKVREGRLERELRHVGLGVDAGGGVAPERSRPPSPRQAKPAPPSERGGDAAPRGRRDAPGDGAEAGRERRKQQAVAARHLERERAEARRAARVAEGEARRRAERAARGVEVAQERRERAAQALREAEESLAQACADAETAAAAHRQAQAQLDGVYGPY